MKNNHRGILRLTRLGVFVASTLSLALPSLASGASEAAEAESVTFSRGGLVITFEGGSPDIENWVQELELSRGGALLRSPVTALPASSPLFLDAFRRQLIPARELVNDVTLQFCQPQSPLLSELIDQTGRAIRRGALTKAAETLANAHEALACGIDAATPEVLGRMMLYSGVIRMAAGDAEGLFEDAFNIAPGLKIPQGLKPSVLQRIKQARRTAGKHPRVDVSLWNGDMAGLHLRIDGRDPAAPTLNLPAGRHVVQLIGPDGLAFGGAVVRLQASENPVEWPPPDLRPPPPLALLQDLQAATLEPRLDPAWIERMENYRKNQGYDWLAVDPGPKYTHLYWFWPGGLAERMMAPSQEKVSSRQTNDTSTKPNEAQNDPAYALIPEDERPEKSSPSKHLLRELPAPSPYSGAVTSTILGIGGIVAATIYFQARTQVDEEYFSTYEEGASVRRKGLIAGFASVTLLTGSAVSAGVTLLTPRPQEGVERQRDINEDLAQKKTGHRDKPAFMLAVGGHW